MHEVSRTVRFCVNLDPARAAVASAQRDNTFAGWPSMSGLGAYYELTVACVGEPDTATGYLVDIAEIDQAVREHAIPLVERALYERPGRDGPGVLRKVVDALRHRLPCPIRMIRWQLSPYYSLTMNTRDLSRVLIRQRFEFAAAHRLHVESLSDEENARIFGKCNAPNGHGHNYQVEVSVSTALDGGGRPQLSLLGIESIVARTVIDRFDHTHLNLDTEEFRDLNPSVEHITRTCYDLLASPVEEAGGRLEQVTVWETEKTCCTYPAPAADG